MEGTRECAEKTCVGERRCAICAIECQLRKHVVIDLREGDVLLVIEIVEAQCQLCARGQVKRCLPEDRVSLIIEGCRLQHAGAGLEEGTCGIAQECFQPANDGLTCRGAAAHQDIGVVAPLRAEVDITLEVDALVVIKRTG